MLSIIQALIIPLATLFAAIYIPGKIMVNQIFADLIADYRKPEMGAAILALFHFYKNECNGKVFEIEKRYKERYEREVKLPLEVDPGADISKALHFQRRMAAQFYYGSAALPALAALAN